MKILKNQVFGILLPLLAWLFLVTAGSAQADNIQSLRQIADAVKSFLVTENNGRISIDKISIGVIDPRLRLPACPNPLQAFLPTGSPSRGRTTVGVRCSGTVTWKIYVSARVRIMQKVVVLKHPVMRGQQLSLQDLLLEERDISNYSNGYIAQINDAVQHIMRRPATIGTILTPRMLKAITLVHRGKNVVIVAKDSSFLVRMSGKALMNGAKGERIKVQNLRSKRIIEATVSGANQVTVDL
ncbi:MAG TPA: flagellar basal body P-ring formation protein FlgA [Gammaproteobacteria bacterium]|nr:flagellar basal body P-ring formation protein FlgA [Gammaproteobacteria bacterium]